jgi:hypothetical protein
MNPLQVPEILEEIVVFVENLSSFAQVDRFTHAFKGAHRLAR